MTGWSGSGSGSGEPTVSRSGAVRGDTVHVDVVDAAGNMISATPSGGWLQSSPTIPALGFRLGTRAQMFWLEEGLPSWLVPGRRPRTTLSPSLGLRDGDPWLAFGTPGGDQQDQWQLCFWLAHTIGGLDSCTCHWGRVVAAVAAGIGAPGSPSRSASTFPVCAPQRTNGVTGGSGIPRSTTWDAILVLHCGATF